MGFFTKLKNWYLIIILSIIVAMYYNMNRHLDKFEDKLNTTITPSLQMYQSLEYWSDSFDIPKHIAYNVAYLETRYRGPFDFNYKHIKTSSAGAVGPMQIIPKWATKYVDRHITDEELKQDIDLNVMVSMKMLHTWYSIYNDWEKACGAYNSGQPISNDYAIYASNNKDYKSKWEQISK